MFYVIYRCVMRMVRLRLKNIFLSYIFALACLRPPPPSPKTKTKNYICDLCLCEFQLPTQKNHWFRDSAPMLPIHPKGLRNVQISLVNLHVSYSVSSLNFSRVTVIIYFLAMQNMYGMQTKNIKTYVDSIRKYISKDGSSNHQ